SAEDQKEAWAALLGDDAQAAYRAACKLVASPASAVKLLKEQLTPAVRADEKQLARLLAELDSLQFAVGERATKELSDLGDRARAALQKSLTAKTSAEVQVRVQKLLQRVEIPLPPSELLRQVRAIEVLENIGTPEATLVLRQLAEGAPEA